MYYNLKISLTAAATRSCEIGVTAHFHTCSGFSLFYHFLFFHRGMKHSHVRNIHGNYTCSRAIGFLPPHADHSFQVFRSRPRRRPLRSDL